MITRNKKYLCIGNKNFLDFIKDSSFGPPNSLSPTVQLEARQPIQLSTFATQDSLDATDHLWLACPDDDLNQNITNSIVKTGEFKKLNMQNLWVPQSMWKIIPLAKGFYNIHFNDEDDMNRIWSEGTYT